VSGSVDAVLAHWGEQREQLRQSENQRATLTNYVLVVASAISGLIVQQKYAGGTLVLAALIVVVGLYGAVSAAKYHERAEYHLSQARALTHVLEDMGALGDDVQHQEHRQAHYRKHPRLHRVRLHWLWTGLHLAVAGYGVIMALIILTR
jgi:hypothetical protein